MVERRFSRTLFRTDATITFGEEIIRGMIDDLSLGGMHMRTSRRVQVQAQVEVYMVVPRTWPEVSINATAIVVRHDDSGMGLAFTGMDFESFFVLQGLVPKGLGDRRTAAGEPFALLERPPEMGSA
jgi:hypothetical protein